jgi:N4-gp56 family major capsid protein
MPIINTTGLSDSVRLQYEAKYVEGAVSQRLYDQFAEPVSSDMNMAAQGSAIRVPFLSKLAPSSQTMSESEDLTSQTYVDTYVDITPTSRGNAVEWSEQVEMMTYTEGVAARISNLGENMMESIDLLAQAAALTGTLSKSYVARASLDAGTANHRITRNAFITAKTLLQSLRVPAYQTPRGGRWLCLVNPLLEIDLLNDTSFLAVGQYQDPGLIFNGEIGEIMGFKIISHPDAKVFYGAGADNASVVATTLAADVDELSTTITVAANTNIVAGMRLAIGTEETAGTHYATNESVIVAATPSSTTVTIIGQGENGGLRYAHASGAAVRNADNVIPAVFGGPSSLAKVYHPAVGEFGQVVGPKKTGKADQWTTMAWKFYGGYGVVAQNRLLRYEFASSIDA